MGALEKRIERLEAATRRAGYDKDTLPPEVALYVRHLENARLQLQGLDPEPLTEEEELMQREADERFLTEILPELRFNEGWRGEESQRILDEWERS